MKDYSKRINNAIGQLEGIKRMMEEGKSCVEVLTQLKAARASVSAVMDAYIEGELGNCLNCVKGAREKETIRVLFEEINKK